MINRRSHTFGQIHPYKWGSNGYKPKKKFLGGIIKKITKYIWGDVPRKVAKILKVIGNEKPVTQIWVVRSPVQKYVETLLNFITLGKFDEVKTKYGFDKFFHLSITFNINNVFYRFEKNDLVNLELYKPREDEEKIFCSDGVNMSLNEVIDTTIKRIGSEHFWSYKAFSWNCQDFIKEILTTMVVYSPPIQQFVFQDIEQLSRDLGGTTGKISDELTDIAGGINTIIGAIR